MSSAYFCISTPGCFVYNKNKKNKKYWSQNTTLDNKSVNDAYETLIEEYNSVCEKYIPLKSSHKMKKPPWFTKHLERLTTKKKSLWHANSRSKWKNVSLVKDYRKTREQLKKDTKLAISSFERNIAEDKKNPKKLYSYINAKRNAKPSITTMKDANGSTQTDMRTITNIINSQFGSVFVKENHSTQIPNFEDRNIKTEKLTTVNISPTLVEEKLKQLDINKTAGIDRVHPHVLNKCASSLSVPLALVFSLSLETGVVPIAWSLANVTPIHKKGSRLQAANYRPVSLTSVPCKVLESIIRDALEYHLSTNQLLNPQQHGFVPKKACVTNLLETVDFVTKNLAMKKSIDIVFLDFAKAFDKVPHHRLLHKLRAYGIDGQVLAWFKAFLHNRKQRVVLGDNISEWCDVTSGVPQGSVVGPVLFSIFINDMPDLFRNICKLYADDCKILAVVDNAQQIADLQSDIDAAVNWSKTWLMELNVEKCKVMHIGRNNPKSQYTMTTSNTPTYLQKTTRERDLGVILSDDAKNGHQVDSAVAKANSMIGILKNTFVSRDLFIWKKLYTAYIRPQLEFAVAAWNPYLLKDTEKLEKVQRRATKIPSTNLHAQYTDRCKSFGISTLTERRTRGDLIQLFKILKGFDTVDWNPIIEFPRECKRGLLRREIIRNCDQRFHFFSNRIANAWNNLPDFVIDATDVKDFKIRLDNHNHPPTAALGGTR
jgi:hypothetical protein